jgi:hypothetical protein
MKKIIIVLFVLILLASTSASVLACDPTRTPRPPTNVPSTSTPVPPTNVPPTQEATPTRHHGIVTIIYITPEPSATNPPHKHKTRVPPVYVTATPNTCISDCEFKRLVIELLQQILAEVRK